MNANMTWGHLKYWMVLMLCVSMAVLMSETPIFIIENTSG